MDFYEPPTSYWTFELLGTTASMLAVEAWKISSCCYKSSLLSILRKADSRVSKFLEDAVASWIEGQRSSASQEETNTGDPAGSGSDGVKWPNLHRESFEVTVAAFNHFSKRPQDFGWTCGPKHDYAVQKLAAPIRKAFEAEIKGSWSGQQGNWLEDEGSELEMPDDMFKELVTESIAALKVRRRCNHNGAHPFKNPDPDERQQMVTLYKEMVAAQHPVVKDMQHLAEAAIEHVEAAFKKHSVSLKPEVYRPVQHVDF